MTHGFISSLIFIMKKTTEISPASPSAQQRFRVFLMEHLNYTVDVLAKDEDEAREIALQDDTSRSEAECTFFDAEEIAVVSEDDNTFSPSNGCLNCHGRYDDQVCSHCKDCIKKITNDKNPPESKPKQKDSPTIVRITEEDLQDLAEQKLGRPLTGDELYLAVKTFDHVLDWLPDAEFAIDEAVSEAAEENR
jgi:hypothetical protein